MKASVIALSLLTAVATALPEAGGYGKYQSYGDYKDVDYKNVDYSKDGGKKGWDKDGKGKDCPKGPIPYTSTYSIVATPDQVVNGTTPTGGQKGAIGYYDFGINSDYNLICYHIRLVGFGDVGYQSPAITSTHIHEAAKGASGPPRIAFPNPQPLGNERTSVGCLQGPFRTGINVTGTTTDTGANFHVRQIEQNPAGFFADVHTTAAVPGAVRGQIA